MTAAVLRLIRLSLGSRPDNLTGRVVVVTVDGTTTSVTVMPRAQAWGDLSLPYEMRCWLGSVPAESIPVAMVAGAKWQVREYRKEAA